jgi:hypothetical protein
MTENCKLRKAILSAFYNISQRNFGILLINFVMLFQAVMKFLSRLVRLDQNLVYYASGQLTILDSFTTIIQNTRELCVGMDVG